MRAARGAGNAVTRATTRTMGGDAGRARAKHQLVAVELVSDTM